VPSESDTVEIVWKTDKRTNQLLVPHHLPHRYADRWRGRHPVAHHPPAVLEVLAHFNHDLVPACVDDRSQLFTVLLEECAQESIREFEKPASKEAAGQPPAMLTQVGVQTIKA
jgi:hypothetical protein